MLFRGETDRLAWIGLVVVTENVVGSLFNSHSFSISCEGWIYVVGVGVAAGVAMRRALRDRAGAR